MRLRSNYYRQPILAYFCTFIPLIFEGGESSVYLVLLNQKVQRVVLRDKWLSIIVIDKCLGTALDVEKSRGIWRPLLKRR